MFTLTKDVKDFKSPDHGQSEKAIAVQGSGKRW